MLAMYFQTAKTVDAVCLAVYGASITSANDCGDWPALNRLAEGWYVIRFSHKENPFGGFRTVLARREGLRGDLLVVGGSPSVSKLNTLVACGNSEYNIASGPVTQ